MGIEINMRTISYKTNEPGDPIVIASEVRATADTNLETEVLPRAIEGVARAQATAQGAYHAATTIADKLIEAGQGRYIAQDAAKKLTS
jgi:hypothetical protein